MSTSFAKTALMSLPMQGPFGLNKKQEKKPRIVLEMNYIGLFWLFTWYKDCNLKQTQPMVSRAQTAPELWPAPTPAAAHLEQPAAPAHLLPAPPGDFA